jgi:MFS family permease
MRFSGQPESDRTLGPLLCALYLLVAACSGEIVPLLPGLRVEYGLSPLAVAMFLAAPGVATLAIGLPAGLLADRIGVRGLTVAGTATVALAMLTQAVPSFPMLVGSRCVFSLAFGTVTTTSMAWMARSRREGDRGGLGTMVAWGAVGTLVGPAFGGVLAERFGIATPFAGTAVVAAWLAIVLARQPLATDGEYSSGPPRRGGFSGTSVLVPSMCVVFLVGAAASAVQLIVPLQLHQLGYGPSVIGLALSSSAVVYIVVSVVWLRFSDPARADRWFVAGALLLGITVVPAMLSVSLANVLASVVLLMAPRAALTVTAFPVAAAIAERHQIGKGVTLGLLNSVWAVGFIVAPIFAGLIVEASGSQLAYATLVVPSMVGAAFIAASRRRGGWIRADLRPPVLASPTLAAASPGGDGVKLGPAASPPRATEAPTQLQPAAGSGAAGTCTGEAKRDRSKS